MGKVFGGGGGGGLMGSGLNIFFKILLVVNVWDLCRCFMFYCFVVFMVDSLRIVSYVF